MPDISDSVFGFIVALILAGICAEMGYIFVGGALVIVAVVFALLFVLGYLDSGSVDYDRS
jgi:hypothetical protein